MAEEVTIVIKGENKASGPIDAAKKSITGLEFAADQSSTKLRGMGGGISNMASMLGKAAGPLAVATAGAVALQAGISKAIDLNAKMAAFETVEGDLRQAIANTGLTAAATDKQFAELSATIRSMSEQTGVSVTELNGAMRELTTRTGDADAAQANLERVMALSNMTGKSAAEVAKVLGNALNGQLGPLVELGILTQQQVNDFGKLENKSEGVARAMALLDEKSQGFAKGLPESAIAAGRLDSALERLQVSSGRLIGADKIVSGLAGAVEFVTGHVEGLVAAWNRAPQSITQAMLATQEAAQGMVEAIDITSRAFQEDLGKTLMDTARAAAEQQKFLREELLRGGQITQAQYAAEILRIEENLQDKLLKIRIQRGVPMPGPAALTQVERSIQLEEQRAATLSVNDEMARFQLETDFRINNLHEDRLKVLAGISDEAERAKQEQFFALRIQNERLEREKEQQRLMQSRRAAPRAQSPAGPTVEEIMARAQAELAAAKARAEADAKEAAELDRRNQLASMRLALLREQDPYLRAVLEQTIAEAQINAKELTTLERELELTRAKMALDASFEALDAEAHAAKMARQAELDQAEKDKLDRIKQLRQETKAANDELLGGLDQAIPGLGALSAGLKNVSEIQWGTAEATTAAVSALGGFASVGGQLAGMITSDRKKAAKVEAIFHAAAAVGAFATWAASSFTAGQFGVAAAQHTVAATKFAMVAGSGTPTQTPSRGASGGGAGGGGMMTRDRATAATAGAARQPDVVINVDMGSSTNLRDAVDTGRAIGQSVADAARNEFRL